MGGYVMCVGAGGSFSKWTGLALTLLMCVLSVRAYGIDNLHSEYGIYETRAEQVRGSNCILLYGDERLDTYTAFPLKEIYDETYFLHPDEIANLPGILKLRETEDPIVVCAKCIYV